MMLSPDDLAERLIRLEVDLQTFKTRSDVENKHIVSTNLTAQSNLMAHLTRLTRAIAKNEDRINYIEMTATRIVVSIAAGAALMIFNLIWSRTIG